MSGWGFVAYGFPMIAGGMEFNKFTQIPLILEAKLENDLLG